MSDALGVRPTRRPPRVPLSQTDRGPASEAPDANGLAPAEPLPGETPPPGQPDIPEIVAPPPTVPEIKPPPPEQTN